MAPAATFFPEFGGADRRHEDLLAAGPIELLPDDFLDSAQDPQAEREIIINASRDLTDHSGTDQQLVADHIGISRVIFEGRSKKFRQAHGPFTLDHECHGCIPEEKVSRISSWDNFLGLSA